MESILLKEIEIDGVSLKFDKYNSYNLDKKDWLIYLLYEYSDDKKLKERDYIKVIDYTGCDLRKYIGDEIIIKIGPKTIIGTATVGENLRLKPNMFCMYNNEYYSLNEYYRLFEHYVDEHTTDKLSEKELDKYISGLFKIYYDSIKYIFNMNNAGNIGKKGIAMASYNSIRNNLVKYNFSEPNVFIRNKMLEYDALILKEKKNDCYYYDCNDILATVEIKSSGYRGSIENIADYIEHISGVGDDKERIEGIVHIYFAIFESLSSYKAILEKMDNVIIIVCASKKNNNTFIIPKEYDISFILKDAGI